MLRQAFLFFYVHFMNASFVSDLFDEVYNFCATGDYTHKLSNHAHVMKSNDTIHETNKKIISFTATNKTCRPPSLLRPLLPPPCHKIQDLDRIKLNCITFINTPIGPAKNPPT